MMLRHLAILLCLCGCAAPVHNVTVHVPTVDVVRCPDLSGVLLLRARGVAMHPILKQVMPWSMNGTAAVVANRGGWWYAVTCCHCIREGGTLTVDGCPAEPFVENAEMDVALVRWRAEKWYRQYPLATPALGQTVYCAGWATAPQDDPLNIRKGVSTLHVRRGIVSFIRKDSLGFDAGARRGFSGGPLLTPAGQLVGVNQRMYTTAGVFACAVHPKHVEALLYALPPP